MRRLLRTLCLTAVGALGCDDEPVFYGFPVTEEGHYLAVSRILTDGSFDRGFGEGGFSVPRFPPDFSRGDFAIDAQGTIIVVGTERRQERSSAAFGIALLTAGGAPLRVGPDGTGLFLDRWSGPGTWLRPMVVTNPDANRGGLPATDFVVGLDFEPAAAPSARVERWGYRGLVWRVDSPLGMTVEDLAIDREGRIVAVGQHGDFPRLVRFLATGARDPSFGSGAPDGTASPPLPGVLRSVGEPLYGPGGGPALIVTVDPAGRILVAGRAGVSAASSGYCRGPILDPLCRPFELFVARYTDDGRLDAGFGSGGVVRLDLFAPFTVESYFPAAMEVGPRGGITITGHANIDASGPAPPGCSESWGLSAHFFVARVLDDGTPDPGLRGRGFRIPWLDGDFDGTPCAGPELQSWDLAIDTGGRVYVVGYESWLAIGVLRLRPSSLLPDASFGGAAVDPVPGPDWPGYTRVWAAPIADLGGPVRAVLYGESLLILSPASVRP